MYSMGISVPNEIYNQSSEELPSRATAMVDSSFTFLAAVGLNTLSVLSWKGEVTHASERTGE